MSKFRQPLDSRQRPEQPQRYEHVAPVQLPEHTALNTAAQRVGRTERVQFMLREDEVEAVDTFRFANRCPSRSEAIRVLMQMGLAHAESGAIAETTTAE